MVDRRPQFGLEGFPGRLSGEQRFPGSWEVSVLARIMDATGELGELVGTDRQADALQRMGLGTERSGIALSDGAFEARDGRRSGFEEDGGQF